MAGSRERPALAGQLRVILADDDAIFRTAFATALQGLPWVWLAGSAADGIEATELCETEAPDLVVLDIVMPRCDGIEAMRRIRAQQPELKVLIVSSSDDARLFGICMSYGAAACVRKDALMRAIVEYPLLQAPRAG
jgi:DNA-binding NarL/FixJ family response regulator